MIGVHEEARRAFGVKVKSEHWDKAVIEILADIFTLRPAFVKLKLEKFQRDVDESYDSSDVNFFDTLSWLCEFYAENYALEDKQEIVASLGGGI